MLAQKFDNMAFDSFIPFPSKLIQGQKLTFQCYLVKII